MSWTGDVPIMLGELTGAFLRLVRFDGRDQLFTELAELLSSIKEGGSSDCFRLNIYGEMSGVVFLLYLCRELLNDLIIVKYDEASAMLLDVREGAGEGRCLSDLPETGFIEVYGLSNEQFIIDKEIFTTYSELMGIPADRIMCRVSADMIERFKPEKAEVSQASLESRSETCSLVIRSLVEGFASSDTESLALSKSLSRPTSIGKILLTAEDIIIKAIPCEELPTLVYSLMSSEEPVAIKIEAGNVRIWMANVNGIKGIDTAVRNEHVSGPKIIEKWDNIQRAIDTELGSDNRMVVYIYKLQEETEEHTSLLRLIVGGG